MMKKCSYCGELKSVLNFNKHHRKPDGLQPRCRRCQRNQNHMRLEPKRCVLCCHMVRELENGACRWWLDCDGRQLIAVAT